MMGRSHAASGAAFWLAGCAAAPTAGVHPGLVTAGVGMVVCALSAYVPDIDHRSSKAARSGGWLTYGVACVVASSCARIHAATKTDRDRADLDGHRTCTHTAVFAVLAGALVTGVIALAGVRWPVLAGWVWLGLPVAAGCVAHCLGDALTNSGCPILWPLKVAGRRWYPVGPPRRWRFGTNGPVERWVVMPALTVAVIVFGWLVLSDMLTAAAPLVAAR